MDSEKLAYYPLRFQSILKMPIPEGKRVPFGWKAIPLIPSLSVFLRLDNTDIKYYRGQKAYLRLSIALDVREEKYIEVFLNSSGRVIDNFDIRYAYVFQPFEICINDKDIADLIEHGVGLRMVKGNEPLWIFYNEVPVGKDDFISYPHIVFDTFTDPLQNFYSKMLSISSIQPFGWMEGCVLDGLLDMEGLIEKERVLNAIKEHLNMFFDKEGNLIYENPKSEPTDNNFYGIESTLPVAVIAKVFNSHHSIESALRFWLSNINTEGCICDKNVITAEGSYTVAYPLSVIASLRRDEELAEIAVRQILIRKNRLTLKDNLFLRYYYLENKRTFKNWGRAYAWYMLGLIKSFEQIAHIYWDERLNEEFKRISEIVVNYQDRNGLWHCFIDDYKTEVDTSASAGIASAIARGIRNGLLPREMINNVLKSKEALIKHLTFDGFLKGVAQANKGGEELQRSKYRVISQWGMGLMAQFLGTFHKLVTG